MSASSFSKEKKPPYWCKVWISWILQKRSWTCCLRSMLSWWVQCWLFSVQTAYTRRYKKYMTCSMIKPHTPVVSVLISESQYSCHGQIIMGKKVKKNVKSEENKIWARKLMRQNICTSRQIYQTNPHWRLVSRLLPSPPARSLACFCCRYCFKLCIGDFIKMKIIQDLV